MKSSKRKYLLIIVGIIIFIYYQMDYKRYIISDRNNKKHITIWPSSNNRCFIVPGKYFSPFKPRTNYIETVNHLNYIGIVWNTGDSYKYKISIYNNFQTYDADSGIKIYEDNKALLMDYGIKYSKDGGIVKSDTNNIIKSSINYEYIDLNRIWGIKRYTW